MTNAEIYQKLWDIKYRYMMRRVDEIRRRHRQTSEMIKSLTHYTENDRITVQQNHDANDQPRDEKGRFAEKGRQSKSLSQLGTMMEVNEMKKLESESGGETANTVPSNAADVIKQYGPKVRGMKSKYGVVVGEISEHAADRIVERSVTQNELEKLIQGASIIYPGKTPNTVCQQKGRLRLILDKYDGTIVSIVDLR